MSKSLAIATRYRDPSGSGVLRARPPARKRPAGADLLLILLEADGSLVTKEELMSRVWPGIVVAEENLDAAVFFPT